jgi:protein-tyrosine-phosphatase
LSDFRAVFVCTGNRFRSPLAAALFRREAEQLGVSVDVQSFGLLEPDGSPALGEALELGNGFGVELASHRSRALRSGALQDVDLVVGFERMHVAAAVVDAGARREVTYTLPELVSLLAEVRQRPSEPGAAGARELVLAASSQRAEAESFTDVPELADPFGQPYRRQEELAVRVADLTQALARRLFSPS